MTREDFEILTHDRIRSVIENNIDANPSSFALAHSHNDFPAPLVSSQIKYLQKAKEKMPTYYRSRCIIPPLAYEQSSSEVAASMKNVSGKRCLDLTCGLGVDSLHFTRNFTEVTSLEKNDVLCEVTRFNFRQMGISNIHFVNQNAESFVETYSGPRFDLIYADPSRRDTHGRKVHDPLQYSPDITAILPRLLEIGNRILIKLSPLFDIAEAQRVFPQASRLMVFSVNNECKELLIDINQKLHDPGTGFPEVLIRIFRDKGQQEFAFDWSENRHIPENGTQNPACILDPDVAFYKARRVPELMLKYFPDLPGEMNHPEGFFFATQDPGSIFPGRRFAVSQILPFKPKILKKTLKEKGISRANIVKRDFPLSVAETGKRLGISEGGEDYLIFSHFRGDKFCFIANRE